MQLKYFAILLLIKFLAVSCDEPKEAGCGQHTVRVPSGGCADACPLTCKNRNPQVCIDICFLNGCNCEKGFIRSVNRTSPCIRPSQCPCNNKH